MTPNSKVHLLAGVTFNNSYTNVRSFNSLVEQQNYFQSKIEKSMLNSSYQRVNANSLRIGYKYDDIENINYLMFQNNNKWYYAFVISIDYLNENTSIITYELDVYQTFMFDFEFKTSFVEREHVKRFNSDGSPIYYLEDEELNYGSAYDIVSIKKYNNITSLDNNDYDIGFLVIATPMDLTVNGFNTYGGSTFNKINSNLFYYIIPFNKDLLNGYPIGVNNTYVSSSYMVLQALSSVADLVGKTCSIYYTNYLPFEVEAETKTGPFGPDNVNQTYINLTMPLSVTSLKASAPYNLNIIPIGNLDNIETLEIDCGLKYSDIEEYSESKLYQYPYTIFEMTDFKGHNFVIKPEFLNDTNIKVGIQAMLGSSPKIAFIPKNYNCNGYLIENGFIDSDTNDIPIINDATASYIQSNRNVLNLQDTYASDNATRSVIQTNANLRITNGEISTNETLGYISSGVNALSGIVNIASGNIGVGVNSLVSSGMSTANTYYDSMYARQKANQNANFSNINARISAEQEIGLRQAKLQDINNQPPTISGQGKDIIFSNGYRYEKL